MAGSNQPNDEQDFQAPPFLIKVLGELHKESVFIPPAIDDAVLRRARTSLARTRQRRLRRRATAKWLALAASVVLAGGIVLMRSSPSGGNSALAREDINHDGRVDILDAFQLAREISRGKALLKADLNGDGKVDDADIEIIAKQAVVLGKGGRS